MKEKTLLDHTRLPLHIGVIMDGNGRWARQRKKRRTFGHKEGLKAAKRVVRAAADIGIQCITLYAFSTENWKRTQQEVTFLMRLVKNHLRNELDFYREHRIRVIYSGDIPGLPGYVADELKGAAEDTRAFGGLIVNLAVNYGGQYEIVRACNRWLQNASRDSIPGEIPVLTAGDLEAHLDNPQLPPIDLVIRTGGERRLSNFFIWETAYAELYFDSKLWPDWDGNDLIDAILDFQKRERRFGNIK
ncbi:MAG: di-trans,poly-cis-decaprenylcistransferase [Spirochaetales bacterium]|nr:di-trans,poly-cis-decaprenylcistransferase [Spirochaetales bacterium]